LFSVESRSVSPLVGQSQLGLVAPCQRTIWPESVLLC
jgi:hypothetical protein